MAVRAAIVLSLAAFAWIGSVRAEDDPSCAQYREPMAYNDCLARHGPKANAIGKFSGHYVPSRGGRAEASSHTPAPRVRSTEGAQRIHGRMHMEFRVQ
jgi:hypothetical protein